MAIYDCETIKDGVKHHYIGLHNIVRECKDQKDNWPTIMCKDSCPFHTVSVTYNQGIQTILPCEDEPIYLFHAFNVIVAATRIS